MNMCVEKKKNLFMFIIQISDCLAQIKIFFQTVHQNLHVKNQNPRSIQCSVYINPFLNSAVLTLNISLADITSHFTLSHTKWERKRCESLQNLFSLISSRNFLRTATANRFNGSDE